MKVLVVLSLAAVACGSTQLLRYPNVYGGISGVYVGSNLGGYISNSIYSNYLRYGYPQARPIIEDVTIKAGDIESTPVGDLVRPFGAYPIPQRYLGVSPLTYNTPSISSLAASPYNIASMAPIQSRYHAQDEFGQYSFSFAGGPSSRSETRDLFGNVRGSFNYIDADGEVQTQYYVSDAEGFRVEATNLPVAPEVPEVPALQPVQYTPEVAAARADFLAVYSKAKAAAVDVALDTQESQAKPESRKKRSIAALPAFTSPLGFPSPLQYSYPSIMSRPFTYSSIPSFTNFAGITPYSGIPAFSTYTAASPAMPRDAEMIKIMNNPGHATSYRVY
ncbi:hypothetical protein Pmani_021338 [Petrolisthes manimaculis]|uniref:Cuticle protein 6 n=1 Tax=Petrolisthes manimaculis TaxID=1843537 RepID=A0AAE1PE15_9EUCA|nr:hypothetical protein Pmani_021338 [Petrolisthes manimaculis]